MKKLFAMLAFVLPMTAMAQEMKDTTVVLPAQEYTFIMAAQLAQYGYANNDALSLINAARLAKQNGYTPQGQAKEEVASEATAAPTGEKHGQMSLDPAKLLADAKAKAGDNGLLLALIDDVQNGVMGDITGPNYHPDCVNAHATDIYNITFRGGEYAYVSVIGDGDTDLDLYIYDQNGNLIAQDIDYTDRCVCTWTPRWTGSFRIKIVNRGSVYNCYVLRTN